MVSPTILALSVCLQVAAVAASSSSPKFIDLAEVGKLLNRSRTRHEDALKHYETNSKNPELVQRHDRVLQIAREEEQKQVAARLGKREWKTGHGVAKRQSSTDERGRVPLLDFFSEPLDIMIYGNISIGTNPAQVFPMLMDTGSADLWVYAEGTGSDNNEYNAAASNTSVTSTEAWSIMYGRGEQEGLLNQDFVELGGYSVDTVFAAASTLNEAFEPYPISGIFGLGFGLISASGRDPWFELGMSTGLITNPYFSIYLVRASDITSAPQGSVPGAELCVGCYDPSKYVGEINWNPVVSVAFWSIACDGIALNGTILADTAMTVALDSGTTLIQIPVAAAEAFYREIGGEETGIGDGTWIVPCDAPIGSLAFSFGGVAYEIPPEDLIRAANTRGTQCILTIAGVDNRDARGNPVAIIGDAFLKNAYSIYSYSQDGAPAVGLAKSNIAGDWFQWNGSTSSQVLSVPAQTGSINIADPTGGGASASITDTRGASATGVSGLTSRSSGAFSAGTATRTPASVVTVTVGGSSSTPTSGATKHLPSGVVLLSLGLFAGWLL